MNDEYINLLILRNMAEGIRSYAENTAATYCAHGRQETSKEILNAARHFSYAAEHLELAISKEREDSA